jgi:chemotaxis protein methyltransferase CheR
MFQTNGYRIPDCCHHDVREGNKQMITPEQFRFFAEMVKSSSGIALVSGKEYLLESRLNELARILGLRGIDELYKKAKFQITPRLREQIIEAMTTNETSFFRDQHPFEAIRKIVIPEIIKKNQDKRTFRFWSAACSTGQEPFSVAMMIAENFHALSSWQVQIMASDISPQAIQKGSAGRFTQVEVNRGLPVQLLLKHFKQQGAFWIINDRLKQMVQFKNMNLLGPLADVGIFDIIFCRYVLIYFDQDTKRLALEKLTRALSPGGYLFLGATEIPVGLPSSMKRDSIENATCWKKEE